MTPLLQVENRFEGGLTGREGRALREKLEKESERAEAAALEAERHKEIADIASEQAMAMEHQVRVHEHQRPVGLSTSFPFIFCVCLRPCPFPLREDLPGFPLASSHVSASVPV